MYIQYKLEQMLTKLARLDLTYRSIMACLEDKYRIIEYFNHHLPREFSSLRLHPYSGLTG
jgi:hypothetical protein